MTEEKNKKIGGNWSWFCSFSSEEKIPILEDGCTFRPLSQPNQLTSVIRHHVMCLFHTLQRTFYIFATY